METTFEKVKIGDKVWDFMREWGMVTSIDAGLDDCGGVIVYPIHVTFGAIKLQYSYDGKYNVCGNRTLFWDEVKIQAPPRPKRMVKKVGWVHWSYIFETIPLGMDKSAAVKVEYETEE